MNIDYMRSSLKIINIKRYVIILNLGSLSDVKKVIHFYTMFTKMINGNTEIIMVQMISQKICFHPWEKKVNAMLFWDLSVVTLFLQV